MILPSYVYFKNKNFNKLAPNNKYCSHRGNSYCFDAQGKTFGIARLLQWHRIPHMSTHMFFQTPTPIQGRWVCLSHSCTGLCNREMRVVLGNIWVVAVAAVVRVPAPPRIHPHKQHRSQTCRYIHRNRANSPLSMNWGSKVHWIRRQGRQTLESLVWVNHPHTDCCCHCPTPIGCLPGLQGWPSINSCYQCIAAKCEGHVNGRKALNISKYNSLRFF